MTAKFLTALVSAVIPGSDDTLLSEASDNHQIPYLKGCTFQMVSRPVSLGVNPHLGPKTRFL
jgi:hypothetical protein